MVFSKNPQKKVVIIDDEEIILKMYGDRLASEKRIKLFIAINGKEGLKVIRQSMPHLILLDIIMPISDGFELLEKLKADPNLKGIPVIMLTNLANDEDRKQSFKRGAAHYWVKADYTPTEVLEMIQRKLGLLVG